MRLSYRFVVIIVLINCNFLSKTEAAYCISATRGRHCLIFLKSLTVRHFFFFFKHSCCGPFVQKWISSNSHVNADLKSISDRSDFQKKNICAVPVFEEVCSLKWCLSCQKIKIIKVQKPGLCVLHKFLQQNWTFSPIISQTCLIHIHWQMSENP